MIPGHLKVLSREALAAYRKDVANGPGGMSWTEPALGLPIEVKVGSIETLALANELLFEKLLSSSLDIPITALCLHAESLFIQERYREFRSLVLKYPEVGDYLLTPRDFCRRPNHLVRAQAAVRYIRTTRAARTALDEVSKE